MTAHNRLKLFMLKLQHLKTNTLWFRKSFELVSTENMMVEDIYLCISYQIWIYRKYVLMMQIEVSHGKGLHQLK